MATKQVKQTPMIPQARKFTPANKVEGSGYPDTAKTSGIVVRGGKAQTKGKLARGPMA
jgi:hypothetical protein